jgi:hypothetical protein
LCFQFKENLIMNDTQDLDLSQDQNQGQDQVQDQDQAQTQAQDQDNVEDVAASPDAGSAETKKGKGKRKSKSQDQNQNQSKDGPFSQFAFSRSISVSNAPMRACDFDQARATLDAGRRDVESVPLVESPEAGVTGRKDANSARDDQNNVTFAQGRYACLPQGWDAVIITFDLKIHNATHMPQSANLKTWESLHETQVSLGETSLSLWDALTCRVDTVLDLVAQQVFSGSWAWRNRREATQWLVRVFDESQCAVPDAQALASAMQAAFHQNRPTLWHVVGVFKLGGGTSRVVFPSQLLKIDDLKRNKTDDEDKGKSVAEFYRIPSADGSGDFALRAVKVSNRLKTIDTWYKGFEWMQMAIPVEPMGYVHALRATLRDETESAVGILSRFVNDKNEKKGEQNEGDPMQLKEEEALYLSAITLFGGLLTAASNDAKGEQESEK